MADMAEDASKMDGFGHQFCLIDMDFFQEGVSVGTRNTAQPNMISSSSFCPAMPPCCRSCNIEPPGQAGTGWYITDRLEAGMMGSSQPDGLHCLK